MSTDAEMSLRVVGKIDSKVAQAMAQRRGTWRQMHGCGCTVPVPAGVPEQPMGDAPEVQHGVQHGRSAHDVLVHDEDRGVAEIDALRRWSGFQPVHRSWRWT